MNPFKDIGNDQIHNATPTLCSTNPGNAYLGTKSLYSLHESECLNNKLETEDIFQDLVEINDSTTLLQDISSIDEFPKFSGRDEFILHDTRRAESSVSERNVHNISQAKHQKEKKEDVTQKLAENKKHNQRPARTRSTEIHNISERRRRDRIRRKLRTLQQLIPRCYKADKASILDDVIQYLKALQDQVKLMSGLGGTTTYQVASTYISPSIDTGSRQIPHFSPLLPRPTAMEMAAMCNLTGLHMAPTLPSPAYAYMMNPFPSIGVVPPCGNLLPQLQQQDAPISNNHILLPESTTSTSS